LLHSDRPVEGGVPPLRCRATLEQGGQIMAHAEYHEDDETIVETDKARSGVTGHHVRYVLAFGIAGVVIALMVVALLH
jgi:hypothetical protein